MKGGGKRKSKNARQQGPPLKKKKRSKKFWQQRRTAKIAPVPKEEDDDHSTSDDDESEEEGDKNNYQALLEAFSSKGDASDESEGESPTSSNDDGEEEEGESDEQPEADENVQKEMGEAGEEEEEEEDSADERDELVNDPFLARIEAEIPEEVQKKVKEKDFVKQNITWSSIGRFIVQRPQWKVASSRGKSKKDKCLLDDDEHESDAGTVENQEKLVNVSLDEPMCDFFLTDQLDNNLALANAKNLPNMSRKLTGFQSELLSLLTTYKDVYFSEQTHSNMEQIRLVYVLHALNHMLKTRSKILKNSHKLSKNGKAASNVRDQGLCRPKIVIVVPFKESARRVVDVMGKLLFGQVKGGNVSNKKRFDDEFGSEPKGLEKLKASGSKPDDFYETFCGDTDDGFKIGLAVTKKTLKLYADFYSSDVIVASPLGLRMVIGVEGEAKRDYDFLASLEMIIFDQMDVLAMQNWDHIGNILEHMHHQPSQSHGIDFTRVRLWSLNGLSKMYRQTVVFSSVSMPEVNAILSKDCQNYAGQIRLANPCLTGSISSISTSVPIVFHRFETSSAIRSVDDRFDYFCNRIMPDFKKDLMYHTLIFVPSYFDFIRLRNWFNGNDLDLAEISEYTKEKKVAMARDLFFHSEKHFLLYSERAHFYRRYAIKGIRHLIFYQLPQWPKFFSELCNFMHWQNKKGSSSGNMSCTVLYGKYDVHRLAPVVCTERAQTMLSSSKSIHMFSPGQD